MFTRKNGTPKGSNLIDPKFCARNIFRSAKNGSKQFDYLREISSTYLNEVRSLVLELRK